MGIEEKDMIVQTYLRDLKEGSPQLRRRLQELHPVIGQNKKPLNCDRSVLPQHIECLVIVKTMWKMKRANSPLITIGKLVKPLSHGIV